MSLISDALKKARQEAARQDAAQRGLPYAVGGAEASRRGGLAGPLVAGLAAGAVLVGAGALAAYLGHWGPWRNSGEPALAQVPPAASGSRVAAAGNEGGGAEPDPAPAIVPSAPAEPLPSSAAPGSAPAVPPAGGSTVAAEAAPRPQLASPPVQVAPPPQAPAVRPEARPVPAPPSPSQLPPSAPEAAAPGTEGEERVYTGEVPVPGGGTLRLSGIAFSDNPVAVIDGKIVGRGEVIQGFTIVEIQRGRVRLQGHGQNVVVAVR